MPKTRAKPAETPQVGDVLRDRVKEFRRVPSAELQDNDKNWRVHPNAQTKALEEILEQVGIAGALTAYHSERNGGKLTLIDGHERRGHQADWPTLILDVSDAEADLLLLTLDPISAMAGSDTDALRELLAAAQANTPGLQDLLQALAAGADQADEEIARLLREGDRHDPDITPPVPVEPRSQLGELYELGPHRLMCGDSTDAEQVATLMGDAAAAFMVTDPPYGVSVDHTWRDGVLHPRGSARTGTVANDDRFDWEAAYALTDAPVAYVWHSSLVLLSVARKSSCLPSRAKLAPAAVGYEDRVGLPERPPRPHRALWRVPLRLNMISRPHIRRIGEEKLDNRGAKRYPARRWVVERTFAWLQKSRGILIRYDKKAANYRGLIQLDCALLWYRRLHDLRESQIG